ncbi:efflux RND transporter periplasmic adaptor subunit [Granulicella sp. L46]|uniref:efflux RND transporter periplasmic adaptor subunit n=1 Tax=Granulicella sp. L46 TaxID=1641865 RepID=UPI00131B82FE|nr:efflux RND transporter periplasmic adaptor subunit [Granulicella sp. L46]
MKTRMYQISLAAAVAASLVLAAVLAFTLLHRAPAAPAASSSQDPVVARGPDVGSNPMPQAGGAATGVEAALATVQLSPQRLQEIGVTTATVQRKDVNDTLTVPGNVNMDEERLSYVQVRFPGWIQQVFANATYQYVRKGERLFTIYSPDLVSSQQEYLLARQNQDTFAPNAQDMAAQESGWMMRAAQERLRQFDVPQQAIADLEHSGKVQHDIAITSPASGYIIDRTALPNAYVQPDTKLYTIADLSTVWVYANVFQNDVGRLKPGDSAQVTVDAYPGRKFNGCIDQILPEVDPTTRTARVRLVFRNPRVELKPGMYVNVAISVPLGQQLVIPASAVLQSGSQAIAFLDHGNGVLEPRVIELGLQLDDSVMVLGGLKAGDRVVSSANFLVDSEAQLQTAMGAFSPLPQSAAGSSNAVVTQMQIDLSTQPSPPRKGANTVQVKLAAIDGKPVTGAQVGVTFTIPAMPAMGMAAQHAAATLTDKGNGDYEGSVQLPSGGTWTTTVTVQRGGKAIATRQLSVDATGGM